MNLRLAAVLAASASFIVGCQGSSRVNEPAGGATATDIDPLQGEPDYWLKKQPTVSVSDHDFDRLWSSAEHVSESLLFTIDRRDRRLGLMTTQPDVSAQWFEPWRRELQTVRDMQNSSFAAFRRTIRWQFEQQGGGYTVTPRVLVERETLAERRVSGVLDRAYFQRNTNDHFYGTHETDEGIILPQNDWYPIGRDYALENKLIELMHDRLR